MSNELKRNWIENLRGWKGLNYVYLLGMPMKRTKIGGEPDIDSQRITKLVAHKIIQSQVPIKGAELAILRSVTKLSYNSFACRLGLTYGAIFNWEKNISEQLIPLYEVAVRLMCAEEMNIEVSSKFSDLVGHEHFGKIEIQITSKEPTSKFLKTKVIYKPSYRGYKKVTVIDDSQD